MTICFLQWMNYKVNNIVTSGSDFGNFSNYVNYAGLCIKRGQATFFFQFCGVAKFIPADEYNHYIPWYVCYGTRTGGFTPEAFASAFSSMIATTTSAMSTASGAGGGASAGGGGGASSGGGGAG